jgi:hypothetical protein
MVARTFLTDQLRLSLVAIPIRLYPATNTERRNPYQVHASTPASATKRKSA